MGKKNVFISNIGLIIQMTVLESLCMEDFL